MPRDRPFTAQPGQHLSAADHSRVRPGAATGRLAYLHDLGVDWVYLSPLLRAAAGSRHGYDVVDHDHVDESRGGAEGLAALSAEARRLGMGVLVDIVPNHVGVAKPVENRWWWDLLGLGRSSSYADAFDVDWEAFDGRVMVPVLGDDGVPPDAAYPQPARHYELVSWRRGDSELNYRRFFTINTLAGVRVEEPWVFAESHREIRRWFDEGLVDGLRVDHPDGLRDPRGYLDDLARLTGGAYVLVEKILEPGEALPTSWATAGTTGYDVLAHLDRVLTDPAGQAPLDALEERLRGAPVDWASLTHETKSGRGRPVAAGRGAADRAGARWVRRFETLLARRLPAERRMRWPRCWRASRSTAPTCRRDARTSTRRFANARGHRPDLARCPRPAGAGARRPGRTRRPGASSRPAGW